MLFKAKQSHRLSGRLLRRKSALLAVTQLFLGGVMAKKRTFLLALIAIAAVLLAFPLRQAVEDIIIHPMQYLIWGAGILYRSIPQFWIWVVMSAVIFFILLMPFLDDLPPIPKRHRKESPVKGPIESMAESLKKADRGIYFRWTVANRIGKITRDWIAYRERLDKRWQANDLARLEGQVSSEVYQYLDAGLNGSFADYPRPRLPFIQKQKTTPLDLDPNRVLDTLEREMENECCD